MPSKPPSELTGHLGYWLRAVSNHVSQAFAAKLADRGVTVAEWVLLRTLYERPPLPPSRIAEEIGMTRGAVTKLADRLIGKTLMVRQPDPEDGRAQTLALTVAGRRLVPGLAAIADRNDAEFFASLTERERASLGRILKRMAGEGRMTKIPLD